MSISSWEINHFIALLEREGYIIRRPSETSVPVVLEVVPQGYPGQVSVRADTEINGAKCAVSHSLPFELLLSREDDSFRKIALPKMLAREMSHYIADRMMAGISEQIERKIEPLVPEKRMSLFEIEAYIAEALSGCRADAR